MAKKVDANQVDVVAALRAAGATVLHLHEVADGCPDLLIGIAGINALIEIKDGHQPPSAQRLTPDQVSFHRTWRGMPVKVVTSATQAFEYARGLVGGAKR